MDLGKDRETLFQYKFGVGFCVFMLVMSILASARVLPGVVESDEWNLESILTTIGFVFIVVMSVFSLAGMISQYRRIARKIAARIAHPNEPWKWYAPWTKAPLAQLERDHPWTILGAALAMGILGCAVAFYIPAMFSQSALVGFGLSTISLTAIGVAGYAVYLIFQRTKFGRVTCELRSMPARIGGRLNVVISAKLRLAPTDSVTGVLECSRRYLVGDSRRGGRSIRRDPLWDMAFDIDVDRVDYDPSGFAAIPVDVEIPMSCSPTTLVDEEDRIEWVLKIHAATSGVDMTASFVVPVFNVSEAA